MLKLPMLVVFTIVVIAGLVLFISRPVRVNIQAAISPDFPTSSFSHTDFEQLLQTYVSSEGRVDYERWTADSAAVKKLESYLAAVRKFSPDSAPGRFPDRGDDLAYWIYAYNAWVIRTVLDNWPIDSVTDLKAPIEAVTGLGFFYRLRFPFGGEYLSLYAVENDRIRRQFKDARIHFVLNCASDSCPIARPTLPTGAALESLLDSATREFINNRRNVSVDHTARSINLSTIFKWYKEDFVQELRMDGSVGDAPLLAYLRRYAHEPLLTELSSVDSYDVAFIDYDWALNSSD